MPRLNQIRTGGGDRGETSLGSGKRVSKLEPRVAAGGMIDELNCSLGVALASGVCERNRTVLSRLQHFLFDLGADISIPLPAAGCKDLLQDRINASHVDALENLIAEACDEQPELTNFILPGGSLSAALLHQARSVCRRAELAALQASTADGDLNPHALVALNCLSDLLFVLARRENNDGQSDVTWDRKLSLL